MIREGIHLNAISKTHEHSPEPALGLAVLYVDFTSVMSSNVPADYQEERNLY